MKAVSLRTVIGSRREKAQLSGAILIQFLQYRMSCRNFGKKGHFSYMWSFLFLVLYYLMTRRNSLDKNTMLFRFSVSKSHDSSKSRDTVHFAHYLYLVFYPSNTDENRHDTDRYEHRHCLVEERRAATWITSVLSHG